jgi:hypothetical protein
MEIKKLFQNCQIFDRTNNTSLYLKDEIIDIKLFLLIKPIVFVVGVVVIWIYICYIKITTHE